MLLRAGLLPASPRTRGILASLASLALATAVAAVFDALGLSETNVVLTYILAVTAVAAWAGRGPAVLASFGAVLLFNYLFTHPRKTLLVHDSSYFFTFGVMLVIALLVSALTARIREQSVAAGERERRTERLYRFSRVLAGASGRGTIVAESEARLGELVGGEAGVVLSADGGELVPAGPGAEVLVADPAFPRTAREALGSGAPATAPSGPGATLVCLPLASGERAAGVLALRIPSSESLLSPDGRRWIEAFASQVAQALQRERLAEEVHRTLADAESERLRSTLLSSVSHDFRTPLAAIIGASSHLLETGDRLREADRRELLGSIHDEADRLARVVENLLRLTQIEAHRSTLEPEWHLVEDVVGSALTRLGRALADHPVSTRIPLDLPMLRIDGVLIELVLTNLLDNAAKYSPPGTPIEVSAEADGERVRIAVADRGPGLSDDEKAHAFEKFYRGPGRTADRSRGSGLGLAICAAIARLHSATLEVHDREGGGARFVLSLPVEAQPPELRELDSAGIPA